MRHPDEGSARVLLNFKFYTIYPFGHLGCEDQAAVSVSQIGDPYHSIPHLPKGEPTDQSPESPFWMTPAQGRFLWVLLY